MALRVEPRAEDPRDRTKRRLALFADTRVSPNEALELLEVAIDKHLLFRAGVTWDNVIVSGVSMLDMRTKYKFETVTDLAALGLDAVELLDARLTQELKDVYGAEEVVAGLLRCAVDAAHVSGSAAQSILGVSVDFLLSLCKNNAACAFQVLSKQGPAERHCSRISASVLVATGLTRESLSKLGFELLDMLQSMQPPPTTEQLRRLNMVQIVPSARKPTSLARTL